MYLAGLNFFSGVIIIINTNKFKGVENKEHTSVIGILLDIVFNIADLQRR